MRNKKWEPYFRPLKEKLKSRKNIDIDIVERAFYFAAQAHKNQRRKSGEYYIIHPVAVAMILADGKCGTSTLCTALLHDVIEDGENPKEIDIQLEKNFSKNIYFNVHALSKNSANFSKTDTHQKYLEQFKEAVQMDPIVLFVKLADLLHNLSTIKGLKPERKKTWIKELQYDYFLILSRHFPYIEESYLDMYFLLTEKIHSLLEQNND